MDPSRPQPPSQRPTVLELRSVAVPAFGNPEVVVVDHLDWQVREGDGWLIAGPPGGGKSSVINVAAGLVRPSRGQHLLFGADLSSLAEPEQIARRTRLGVVFGGGGRLFSGLTVAENLALPLLYHERSGSGESGEVGDRVLEVLNHLRLDPQAHRLPRDLPRRLVQRVALARALVLRPEILILDEPTAGLAPDETGWWLQVLGERTADWMPRTLVVATGSPEPWLALAGRFAVVGPRVWRVVEHPSGLDPWLRPPAGD